VALVIEYLLIKRQVLNSNSSTTKNKNPATLIISKTTRPHQYDELLVVLLLSQSHPHLYIKIAYVLQVTLIVMFSFEKAKSTFHLHFSLDVESSLCSEGSGDLL
jgi:hypothetical protein